MPRTLVLAWLQLRQGVVRFLVALAGVAFAVILFFMQLGFSDALFESSVRFHSHLKTDLVMISPRSHHLVAMKGFTRRYLYQAMAFNGVQNVVPIYIGLGFWRNPDTGQPRQILVGGFDPLEAAFAMPEVNAHLADIRFPDVVLFDRGSRPEFGPVAKYVDEGKEVTAEISDRRVRVAAVFQLGTSFGFDGAVLTSDLNFRRLFPNRSKGLIDIGLIQLAPGADPAAVLRALQAGLPRDVKVMTKQQYMEHEMKFWADATPIGFIFSFGAVMALVVGGVIVYQILFTDISNHLSEYATLKAMGYTNFFLVKLVLSEALIMAILGYLPGLAVATWLYHVTANATLLPMAMRLTRTLEILASTVGMCGLAGAMALRKIRAADPAEIF